MRVVALIIALAALVAGCGDSEAERRRELLRAPEGAPPRPVIRSVELFDEQGELLASDEVVAGLRLPRGLKLKSADPRTWIYQSRVPPQKLHSYFGKVLYGGAIEVVGKRTTYASARVREDRTRLLRLEVQVRPSAPDGSVSLVEIRQLPERTPLPRDASALEMVRGQMVRDSLRAD